MDFSNLYTQNNNNFDNSNNKGVSEGKFILKYRKRSRS